MQGIEMRLSASCISCFKACPMRFFLQYECGLSPAQETEALRIGTVYHTCREILSRGSKGVCPNSRPDRPCKDTCYICGGFNELETDPMDSITNFLNRRYESMPEWFNGEEMKIERAMILHAMVGYKWYYQNDTLVTKATELKAESPLFNPRAHRCVQDCVLVYKMDSMCEWNGAAGIGENKTTSKSVAQDSDYWSNLRMATQPSLYIYNTQKAQRAGLLEPWGIKATDPLINKVLYDVFHKPGIGPKNLTQGASLEFAQTGQYCGGEFKVEISRGVDDAEVIQVNGDLATYEPGKKAGTFALHETPDMFGARFLQDISERPDFYFARREIEKTDADMIAFEHELYNIYRAITNYRKSKSWFKNEQQCEATFKCPFMGLCYNNVVVTVESAKTNTPDGFKVYQPETEEAK
jgi:hypothetical protein